MPTLERVTAFMFVPYLAGFLLGMVATAIKGAIGVDLVSDIPSFLYGVLVALAGPLSSLAYVRFALGNQLSEGVRK